jgi:hypothetical protein
MLLIMAFLTLISSMSIKNVFGSSAAPAAIEGLTDTLTQFQRGAGIMRYEDIEGSPISNKTPFQRYQEKYNEYNKKNDAGIKFRDQYSDLMLKIMWICIKDLPEPKLFNIEEIFRFWIMERYFEISA